MESKHWHQLKICLLDYLTQRKQSSATKEPGWSLLWRIFSLGTKSNRWWIALFSLCVCLVPRRSGFRTTTGVHLHTGFKMRLRCDPSVVRGLWRRREKRTRCQETLARSDRRTRTLVLLFPETKALYREVRIIHAAREEERSPRVLTGIKTNSDQWNEAFNAILAELRVFVLQYLSCCCLSLCYDLISDYILGDQKVYLQTCRLVLSAGTVWPVKNEDVHERICVVDNSACWFKAAYRASVAAKSIFIHPVDYTTAWQGCPRATKASGDSCRWTSWI